MLGPETTSCVAVTVSTRHARPSLMRDRETTSCVNSTYTGDRLRIFADLRSTIVRQWPPSVLFV